MGEFEQLRGRDSAGPSAKPASKAPLPKKPPAPPSEHTLRVNVARAALLNAQHWFDKGIASLDGKSPIDWRTIAANAFPSLQEASNVAGALDGVGSQLTERLDETRRAMDTYVERMAARVSTSEAATFFAVVDKLRRPDSALRFAHDLPMHPGQGTHKPASNHDDVYEAQALGATLDLIALEANSALHRVRDSQDAKVYRPVVLATTSALQKDLAYTVSLFDAYNGKDKERAFTAKLQVASIALAGLQRFISGRQNNKEMADQFAPVEANTNKLRAAVHLDPLGKSIVGVSNVQHRGKRKK